MSYTILKFAISAALIVGVSFYPALTMAVAVMLAGTAGMVFVLGKLGIKL